MTMLRSADRMLQAIAELRQAIEDKMAATLG